MFRQVRQFECTLLLALSPEATRLTLSSAWATPERAGLVRRETTRDPAKRLPAVPAAAIGTADRSRVYRMKWPAGRISSSSPKSFGMYEKAAKLAASGADLIHLEV